MTKVTKYTGHRAAPVGGALVLKHFDDGTTEPLPLRLDVFDHSPDGFQWGYSGSGPSQLALALLIDAGLAADLAILYHQDFKWSRIATIDTDDWEISRQDVLDWIIQTARQDLLGDDEPDPTALPDLHPDTFTDGLAED